MAAGMVDEPGGQDVLVPGVPSGRVASNFGASSGRAAAWSAVRIGFIKNEPQLWPIVVGSRQTVIANGNAGGLIEGGQTLQIGQDIGLALGGGHVRQGVASRVLEHALGGTYCEHGFADVGGGHTVAHFDAKRFGKLSVTYRAFGRVGRQR